MDETAKVLKKCIICKKVFESWTCHNRKYCCQRCYWDDKDKLPNAKGKKWRLESRRKLSDSKKGKATWNKGLVGVQIPSEKTKQKMSESHKGKHNWWVKSGSDSPAWKGGVTKIDKLCRVMKEYKQWRTDVFERDNWVCQTCGKKKCYVTAHHIKGFSKIIKENIIKNIKQAAKCDELWERNNGLTLCEKCHSLTDNYRGRAKKHN